MLDLAASFNWGPKKTIEILTRHDSFMQVILGVPNFEKPPFGMNYQLPVVPHKAVAEVSE